ncbi:MAG: hypothetical protein WA746_14855, partial [Isosphaeraceae bacterium]
GFVDHEGDNVLVIDELTRVRSLLLTRWAGVFPLAQPTTPRNIYLDTRTDSGFRNPLEMLLGSSITAAGPFSVLQSSPSTSASSVS